MSIDKAKERAKVAVAEAKDRLVEVSLDIHSHPELALKETRAANLLSDTLEAQGLIRITQRSHHRAELQLLDGTPARRILEAALAHVDDVYRFQLTEPPLNEIFIRVVTEQQGRDVADRVVLDVA